MKKPTDQEIEESCLKMCDKIKNYLKEFHEDVPVWWASFAPFVYHTELILKNMKEEDYEDITLTNDLDLVAFDVFMNVSPLSKLKGL